MASILINNARMVMGNNHRNLIAALLTFCALSAQIGCVRKTHTVETRTVETRVEGSDSETGNGGSSGTPQQSDGPSTGGGGYEGDNSKPLLEWSAKGLAKMIRHSSDDIYPNLPKGWTKERIAKIVEEVRFEPTQDRQRDGQFLVYDYGKDSKGEYIVALRPFFGAYASQSILYSDPSDLAKTVKDIRGYLLREVAHHMGWDTFQTDALAREFGLRLLEAMERDVFICTSQDLTDWHLDQEIPPADREIQTYFFHRPSGIGAWASYYITDNFVGQTQSVARSKVDSVLKDIEVFVKKLKPMLDFDRVEFAKVQKNENPYSVGGFGRYLEIFNNTFSVSGWEIVRSQTKVFEAKALNPRKKIELLSIDGMSGKIAFETQSGIKGSMPLKCSLAAEPIVLPTAENMRAKKAVTPETPHNNETEPSSKKKLNSIPLLRALETPSYVEKLNLKVDSFLKDALGKQLVKIRPYKTRADSSLQIFGGGNGRDTISSTYVSGRQHAERIVELSDGRSCAIILLTDSCSIDNGSEPFLMSISGMAVNGDTSAPFLCWRGRKRVLSEDLNQNPLRLEIHDDSVCVKSKN